MDFLVKTLLPGGPIDNKTVLIHAVACRWTWAITLTCDVPVRYRLYIDGLVQERRNSIALAMELRLSCTNPSICHRASKRRMNDFVEQFMNM